VVCVASGKGGVGKTNVTVNLARALAELEQQVLIMDADLSLANVCIALGLRPQDTVAQVIRGEKSLQDIILEGPGGIQIIPASSGNQKMANLQASEYVAIVTAFSQLQTIPDVLLVDSASGINDNVINFCRAAHDIIVVMSDEPTSFADANALIQVLYQECNARKFHILVNRVARPKIGRDAYLRFLRASEHTLDVTPQFFGAIPEDTKLRRAVKAQSAVLDAYPNSASAVVFRNLAERFMEWPRPGGNGGLQFFINQITTIDSN
jgi:flagellar biosynthesis protein FlhG